MDDPTPASAAGRERKPRSVEEVAQPWLRNFTDFQGQIFRLEVGEEGAIEVKVANEGNFPAWTCYLELYEGPLAEPSPRYSALRLRDRRTITLQAGERRSVPMKWVRERVPGNAIAVCYDPVLDPRDPQQVKVPHRQVSSFPYFK